jgi:aspartyl protease family protein
MMGTAHLKAMMNGDNIAQLIYLGLLLAALGGWVLVEYRTRLGAAMRTALAWGMIFVGLMAGYGLWGDLRRDIVPMQQANGVAVTIPRAADGHYYPTLNIDGRDLTFMADTGATSVVLSRDDARRLGIDPAGLTYLGLAYTANGVVRTATVTLQNVTFGPFTDASVTAQVNEGDMAGSLLGMDYLGRFSVTMAEDQMILTR